MINSYYVSTAQIKSYFTLRTLADGTNWTLLHILRGARGGTCGEGFGCLCILIRHLWFCKEWLGS